jgi:hypothetical protein
LIPANLSGRDPNDLPYFVSDRLGSRIEVCFQMLDESERERLRGPEWKGAVFHEVWPKLIGDKKTLKLVRKEDPSNRIEGMIRLGDVLGPGRHLRHSLLESAPPNRAGLAQRELFGVGRVLVARLIIESVLAGGTGRVLVHPRPGTEPFYRHLGFYKRPGSVWTMVINPATATQILLSVSE